MAAAAAPGKQKAMEEYIRANGIGVVFVDTFAKAFTGESQNDNTDVAAWYALLRHIAGADCDMIVRVHSGWEGSINSAANELAERVGVKAAWRLRPPRGSHHRDKTPSPVRQPVPRPSPRNALTDAERGHVLAVLTSDRFVDTSVAQTWATLPDEGTYLARRGRAPGPAPTSSVVPPPLRCAGSSVGVALISCCAVDGVGPRLLGAGDQRSQQTA